VGKATRTNGGTQGGAAAASRGRAIVFKEEKEEPEDPLHGKTPKKKESKTGR